MQRRCICIYLCFCICARAHQVESSLGCLEQLSKINSWKQLFWQVDNFIKLASKLRGKPYNWAMDCTFCPFKLMLFSDVVPAYWRSPAANTAHPRVPTLLLLAVAVPAESCVTPRDCASNPAIVWSQNFHLFGSVCAFNQLLITFQRIMQCQMPNCMLAMYTYAPDGFLHMWPILIEHWLSYSRQQGGHCI